tara:strand:+ start:441 stop:1175 length:735 start_codon:yes stop_codon:yes gene_type:complete
MIKKVDLQGFINKYYLKMNEQVVWSFKDNILSVDFTTPSKDVIGNVRCEDIGFEDIDLPIFNTKKVQSLVDLCEGEILMEVEKTNKIPTKLKISDEKFNTVYALADALLIPRVGSVNEPLYDVELELTAEDVFNLVKARSAMSETANLIMSTTKDLDGDPVCEVILGEEGGHENKISYQLRGIINEIGVKVPFDLDKFRDILNVNKNSDEGLIQLSSKGLMRLTFKTGKITSTYYMIRRAENVF